MMDDSYIFFSDFVRNNKGARLTEMQSNYTVVESFAELLDKLLNDETKNNKIVPIYVARGSFGDFSVEPIFFCNFEGNPLIFSTAFRLFGKDAESVGNDSQGEQFIYNVYNENNNHVYVLGSIGVNDDIQPIIDNAVHGNIMEDKSIDRQVAASLVLENHMEPYTSIELSNGGMFDVYLMNSAMMDAMSFSHNFNNGQQTIVDFDNTQNRTYIIGIGGNPIIKAIGQYPDRLGFLYTVWTKNDKVMYDKALRIIEDFPFDCIEPDLTDMATVIANHMILHKRDQQLSEAEENML